MGYVQQKSRGKSLDIAVDPMNLRNMQEQRKQSAVDAGMVLWTKKVFNSIHSMIIQMIAWDARRDSNAVKPNFATSYIHKLCSIITPHIAPNSAGIKCTKPRIETGPI